ncbi:MAG: right-handed parallel beta-helix repeat-containing protein [Bryobacteraceae bacterium]
MLTIIRRVVLTGVLAALAGAQAWAVTPISTCNPAANAPAGSLIAVPGNYVVTADLNCTGLGDSDGIDIQASHVTVNLNGHIITGSPAAPAGTGISVNPGAAPNPGGSPHLNHVGISGPGLIRGFNGGITIFTSDYVQVSLTTVAGNAAGGIGALDVTYLTVGENVIVANGGTPPFAPNTDTPGLLLVQSTGAQVNGNQVVGNKANGIVLQSGDSNSLTGNVASGNAGSGILMGDAPAYDSVTTAPLTNSRVSSNTTNGNAQAGIAVVSPTNPALIPFGNEIFSNTQSVGNTIFDLADGNLSPPAAVACAGDFWSGNVFFTKNQACVK